MTARSAVEKRGGGKIRINQSLQLSSKPTRIQQTSQHFDVARKSYVFQQSRIEGRLAYFSGRPGIDSFLAYGILPVQQRCLLVVDRTVIL